MELKSLMEQAREKIQRISAAAGKFKGVETSANGGDDIQQIASLFQQVQTNEVATTVESVMSISPQLLELLHKVPTKKKKKKKKP
jgi:hypothetical protein